MTVVLLVVGLAGHGAAALAMSLFAAVVENDAVVADVVVVIDVVVFADVVVVDNDAVVADCCC